MELPYIYLNAVVTPARFHPFKGCVRYFLSNFYFSPNDSPSKTEKCFLFYRKSSFGFRKEGILRRYDIETLSIDIVLNKEYFYEKSCRK